MAAPNRNAYIHKTPSNSQMIRKGAELVRYGFLSVFIIIIILFVLLKSGTLPPVGLVIQNLSDSAAGKLVSFIQDENVEACRNDILSRSMASHKESAHSGFKIIRFHTFKDAGAARAHISSYLLIGSGNRDGLISDIDIAEKNGLQADPIIVAEFLSDKRFSDAYGIELPQLSMPLVCWNGELQDNSIALLNGKLDDR